MTKVEELQRVVIKEELMALIETYYGRKNGIHMRAAFLNNLIFWQTIQLKNDRRQEQKIQRAIASKVSEKTIQKMKDVYRDGWFYKTAEENEIELMGFCSPSSITRMNKEFKEQGWLEVGKNPNPKKKYDRSTWYRLNLEKINADLNKLGYHLEGFKFTVDEEAQETPSESIFHGESTDEPAPPSIFHGENSIFHDESSIYHHGRTIPEGITEDLSKDFEEEEELITLDDVQSFLNDQISKREITNPKTLTAIFEVAEKCRAIGTSDIESMENFCITVVEEKMTKFGQKQKATAPARGAKQKAPVRTELLPDWYDRKDEQQEPEKLSDKALKKNKQEIEEMLKQLRA